MSDALDPSVPNYTGEVCQFCGMTIDRELKRCPALEKGVCRP